MTATTPKARMHPPCPPRVQTYDAAGLQQEEWVSARCAWWIGRINEGWQWNRRIRAWSPEEAVAYFGVYPSEWTFLLYPLLCGEAIEYKFKAETPVNFLSLCITIDPRTAP